MPDFLPIALLALSPQDSLPVPLVAVDGPQVACTVAEYMDTTVTAWRLPAGVAVEAVIESPGPGEMLVLLVPRDGEDQSTGVDPIEPNEPPREIVPGACGRIFSWR